MREAQRYGRYALYVVLGFLALAAAGGQSPLVGLVVFAVLAGGVALAGSTILCFTQHKELVEGCSNCRHRYQAQKTAERDALRREAKSADMQRLNRQSRD